MSKSQFQNALNAMPARGLVGQSKTVNPSIYAVGKCQAKESITIGNFVWEEDVNLSDIVPIVASAEGSNIKPLGIVAHTNAYSSTDLSLSASLSLSAGQFVDIITKGDVFVKASRLANRGDKVFANIYDGSIEIAQEDSVLEDAVQTDFMVVEGGESGSVITISNWL